MEKSLTGPVTLNTLHTLILEKELKKGRNPSQVNSL
jgi:hypothetical protein